MDFVAPVVFPEPYNFMLFRVVLVFMLVYLLVVTSLFQTAGLFG